MFCSLFPGDKVPVPEHPMPFPSPKIRPIPFPFYPFRNLISHPELNYLVISRFEKSAKLYITKVSSSIFPENIR